MRSNPKLADVDRAGVYRFWAEVPLLVLSPAAAARALQAC